jgi:hypothetical protein
VLHRTLASLIAVLGAAALALGIASATLWRPSDTLVSEAAAAPGTTLLMTEPGVLTMAGPQVSVRATGDDVVIALGRTADVEAWVGRDAHTQVTGLADWNVLATREVAARPGPGVGEPTPPDGGEGAEDPAPPPAEEGAEPPAEGEPEGAAEETEQEGAAEETEQEGAVEPDPAPDPRGSDLWWAEVSGGDSAELEWTETDGRWSVLVASTGAGAGAPAIALTWPREVVTPWLLPGVFVGALLLMIGLAWWALILVAGRRQASAIAAEPEPPEPAVQTAPLTRRQLREAAEVRDRRGTRAREHSSIVDRFPMLVPAPRRSGPAPAPEPTAADVAAPAAGAQVAMESREQPPRRWWGRRGRVGASADPDRGPRARARRRSGEEAAAEQEPPQPLPVPRPALLRLRRRRGVGPGG